MRPYLANRSRDKAHLWVAEQREKEEPGILLTTEHPNQLIPVSSFLMFIEAEGSVSCLQRQPDTSKYLPRIQASSPQGVIMVGFLRTYRFQVYKGQFSLFYFSFFTPSGCWAAFNCSNRKTHQRCGLRSGVEWEVSRMV